MSKILPMKKACWLNKSQMAESCGVSVQAFDKWGVEPVAKIGRESFYEVGAVLKNRLANLEAKHQPKSLAGVELDPLIEYKQKVESLRLTTEQADAVAMRNQVKKRELVPAEFAIFALSRLASQIGAALDTIPIQLKRRYPDLEVRHVEALQREIALTRNEAALLADHLPEILDEFAATLDAGAD